MFKTKNIDHVELTVTNIKRSVEFYSKIPNFKLIAEHLNFSMLFNGYFYLGLTNHKEDLEGKIFDEKNAGLDHLAINLSSQDDLVKAEKFLDKENIPLGKIEKLSNGKYVLAFRDPDNIQLEFSYKP